MATHSSISAWRIPGPEEPGRPQSLGPHRVRHDLATEQQQQTHASHLCFMLKFFIIKNMQSEWSKDS